MLIIISGISLYRRSLLKPGFHCIMNNNNNCNDTDDNDNNNNYTCNNNNYIYNNNNNNYTCNNNNNNYTCNINNNNYTCNNNNSNYTCNNNNNYTCNNNNNNYTCNNNSNNYTCNNNNNNYTCNNNNNISNENLVLICRSALTRLSAFYTKNSFLRLDINAMLAPSVRSVEQIYSAWLRSQSRSKTTRIPGIVSLYSSRVYSVELDVGISV